MRKNFGSKPWFYPLPVLIIGTYNEDNTADAMNAAWGGLYDADKVVLCLSAGHKTTANIKARKAFTVSFADAAHVVPADYVGIVSANREPRKMEISRFPHHKEHICRRAADPRVARGTGMRTHQSKRGRQYHRADCECQH